MACLGLKMPREASQGSRVDPMFRTIFLKTDRAENLQGCFIVTMLRSERSWQVASLGILCTLTHLWNFPRVQETINTTNPCSKNSHDQESEDFHLSVQIHPSEAIIIMLGSNPTNSPDSYLLDWASQTKTTSKDGVETLGGPGTRAGSLTLFSARNAPSL